MFGQLPFVMFALFAGCARSMEPLAILASQPVWQAGEPMKVTMDYDGAEFYLFVRVHTEHRGYGARCRVWSVPATGAMDEIAAVREVSALV